MNQSTPDKHQGAVTVQSLPLGPFATNCYLVSVSDACWIIDASFDPEPMLARIREQNLTPEALILTHAHIDHIAGLSDIRGAFPDIPVMIHKAEQLWLGNPDLNLSRESGRSMKFAAPNRLLRGGETLELGGAGFRVFHTPGHSPGGITLYHPDSGVAIVGDTLFAGSIGRFDFPTSDEETLLRSIRETLYELPPETRVLPGHGPETTIGREMHSNPFVRKD